MNLARGGRRVPRRNLDPLHRFGWNRRGSSPSPRARSHLRRRRRSNHPTARCCRRRCWPRPRCASHSAHRPAERRRIAVFLCRAVLKRKRRRFAAGRRRVNDDDLLGLLRAQLGGATLFLNSSEEEVQVRLSLATAGSRPLRALGLQRLECGRPPPPGEGIHF